MGILLGSLVLTVVGYHRSATSVAFAAEVEAVIETCAAESYRPSCYDRELPKYMDQGYSMEEVFGITKAVQTFDPEYQYCHVLGHYLSQKETAKDPSKWKDVIARAPRGICSNGAIHGAFQERFQVESLPEAAVSELKKELFGICEPRKGWEATQLERGSCLHALGHLTMYATDGNIDKSLALCDELLIADERSTNVQLCYDGAFMQIFQPLEPEDIALVDHYDVDSSAKAQDFCEQYTGAQFGSCNSESWPLVTEKMNDPQQIGSVCEPVAEDSWQHERCLNGVFYVVVAMMNLETARVYDFCSQVPDSLTARCFSNAVSRMVEVDWDNAEAAVRLCAESAQVGASEACYNELLTASTYSFTAGSPEFVNLCEQMPGSYKKACFGKM